MTRRVSSCGGFGLFVQSHPHLWIYWRDLQQGEQLVVAIVRECILQRRSTCATAEYGSGSTRESRLLGEMEVKRDARNAFPFVQLSLGLRKDATRAVENITKRDYDNKQHS